MANDGDGAKRLALCCSGLTGLVAAFANITLYGVFGVTVPGFLVIIGVDASDLVDIELVLPKSRLFGFWPGLKPSIHCLGRDTRFYFGCLWARLWGQGTYHGCVPVWLCKGVLVAE